MIKVTGPVPYGNCAIRDKIGNAKIIISTDCIAGISQEEINRRYQATQEVYGEIEETRALYEARKG